MQFKLDPRLARVLGIHTQTRPVIINALWQYIKTHKLQDPYEREYINCDKYMEQVSVWGWLISSNCAGLWSAHALRHISQRGGPESCGVVYFFLAGYSPVNFRPIVAVSYTHLTLPTRFAV